MLLYINRETRDGPWGGGAKAVNALVFYAEEHGFRVVKDCTQADAVLLMGLNPEDGHIGLDDARQLAASQNIKVFLRANNCDASRQSNNIDKKTTEAYEWLDGVIFVSEWLKKQLEQHTDYVPKNSAVIKNGVDSNVFRPNSLAAGNPPKFRIVSHHWSDNHRKSGKITKIIDDFVGKNSEHYEFTFVGRTKCDLKHARVIPPLSGKALGDELREHDFYFSEALFDAGPNHILEAIASGLPTYVHRDGGGCVEFAGADHVYSTPDELIEILRTRQTAHNKPFRRSWSNFAQETFDFIKKVI